MSVILRPQAFAPYGGLFPRSHAATPNDAIVPAGLVGWWTMDVEDVNFVAGTVVDRSGNGDVGTLFALPASSGAVGQIGGALNFVAGNGSYISTPTQSIAGAVSMSCWVNSATLTTQNAMFICKNPVNNQWELLITSNSFVLLRGGSTTAVTVATPSNNVWHHLCGVISGAAGTIYIDGAPVASGAVTPIGNGSGNIEIGRFNNGFYFNGLMDDVRIYNRALDQGEILQLYSAGLAGMGYWPSAGMPLMAVRGSTFNPGWARNRNTIVEGIAS